MRTVAFIVARMGSTRVPGKAMIDLCGRPVIFHVLEAVRKIKSIDDICLATTTLAIDDQLIEVANSVGVKNFRGDPEKVLDRVYGALQFMKADVLIDVGGDCPLVDPIILDHALSVFKERDLDYLCNYEPPTYPEGLDINILKASALKIAFDEAVAPSQRIHPFSYLTRHKDRFKIGNIEYKADLSELHWSLDFPEDVEFIRAVYENLYEEAETISMEQVLTLIRENKKVALLNEKIMKPKSLHAFWNSPGIIRDMHADVSALTEMGHRFLSEKNFAKALAAYNETESILKELRHISEFKMKEGKPL